MRKAIKCAEEQRKRGLYFVLETIVGEKDEKSSVVQELVSRNGSFVSREYSIMYREGAFGWVVTKARVVTNSTCIRDNIDNMIAGRHWMKTLNNEWMMDSVEKGIKQESEMTIMGIDNEAFALEEGEVRKYWDDLSGKELDARLVKEAR